MGFAIGEALTAFVLYNVASFTIAPGLAASMATRPRDREQYESLRTIEKMMIAVARVTAGTALGVGMLGGWDSTSSLTTAVVSLLFSEQIYPEVGRIRERALDRQEAGDQVDDGGENQDSALQEISHLPL